MAASPLRVLSRLESRVTEFVWKPLQKAYGLPTNDRPSNLKLGEVKFFGTIVTDSQSQGVPLWEVAGGNAGVKQEAFAVFSRLGNAVITRTL